MRTPHGYSLDAVVHFEGRDVAVEVDGPTHFGDDDAPTGSTLLKRRQVRAAGSPLFSVPYWEWEKVKSDPLKAGEYLSRGLREALSGADGVDASTILTHRP